MLLSNLVIPKKRDVLTPVTLPAFNDPQVLFNCSLPPSSGASTTREPMSETNLGQLFPQKKEKTSLVGAFHLGYSISDPPLTRWVCARL